MRYAPTIVVLCLSVSGCITPFKEEATGKYILTAQTEVRSLFGTNQSFARLERCDVEEPILFYTSGNFSNCVMMSPEEQTAWTHAFSRGSGPEIVGAAILGGSLGTGAAMSGGARATAGATAGASNIAIQTITAPVKH